MAQGTTTVAHGCYCPREQTSEQVAQIQQSQDVRYKYCKSWVSGTPEPVTLSSLHGNKCGFKISQREEEGASGHFSTTKSRLLIKPAN